MRVDKVKFDAIAEDSEARRDVRKAERKRKSEPAKMRDKPMKGTSEAEPLNENKITGRIEGTNTREDIPTQETDFPAWVTRNIPDKAIAISEEDVRLIMITRFDRHQAYLFQKAQNTEEARFKRRQTLNADLGRHLPKGRGRTVSLRVYADECMGNLPKDVRKRILGIISAIDGLEDDTARDEFRKPVYFPDLDDLIPCALHASRWTAAGPIRGQQAGLCDLCCGLR